MKTAPRPPQLILKVFRWFCDPKIQGYIEGDLFEVYNRRLTNSGKWKADLRFIIDVLLLFRPGIIKIRTQTTPNLMFRNNLKIAVRSLWKNKASTTINVLGLTTGIASCLLIALFIRFELSYDQFQPNKERIARVIMEYSFDEDQGGAKQKGNFTSTKVAPVFSRTFPEVEHAVRMFDADMIVMLNNEPVTEKNFMYADSSFFDVFENEFIEGNPGAALDGRYKVVLTQSTANKYFPEGTSVGKSLLIGGDQKEYEVTGVIKDYPANSQIQFDFLASFSSQGVNQERTYFNANYTTYLLLTDSSAIASLQDKLGPFMDNEMRGSGTNINFELEPFEKIHLHSPYAAFTPNTSMRYLFILGGVGFLIIVIVCFTYINLSTARSLERAREVGIRKMSGAVRGQVFWQFIGESLILCSLSVIVSFFIAAMALPLYNSLISKTLSFSDLISPAFLGGVALATVTISFIAGGYPAIVLSGMQPAKVLKGLFKNSSSGRTLQQSLTVFQFAISVFLIITTIVIQSQLHFIQHQKLGYDREHVIALPVGWSTDFNTVKTLRTELEREKSILSTSRCASTPVNIASGYTMRLPSASEKSGIITNANPVDAGYLKTAGLELVAGSDFTDAQVAQTATDWEQMKFKYIINETAAKELGFASPADAVGREMILNAPGMIVGVIKDFNFQSMRNAIQPLVLFTASWGNKLLVKVDGNNMQNTITAMERTWKQLLPNRPFDYSFLDEEYNRIYRTELQLGQMMNVFACIAIVLASLGLYGLSSYMIQQRMKEISIRKVMGASIINLFGMLSSSFVVLVVIAIVIAIPFSYIVMRQWLDGFVFRITLEPWIFIVAALSTVLLALLTIGIRGLGAAAASPAKNLRSE
jgi:putative ABC transport system permease protein